MIQVKYLVGLVVALLMVLAGGFLLVQTTAPEAMLPVPVDSAPLGDQSAAPDATPVDGDTRNLSGQNLTQVPADTFDRLTTQTLNLSNNQLTGALPGEVRFLRNLQVLNLSDNNFTGVPAEVGQLTKLKVLNLANNHLTGLPHELGNLTNLELLDLRGNDYSEQDLAVIKERLPSTTVIKVE